MTTGQQDETVADPVCGMTIKKSEAVATIEHEGQTHYFCSQNCADSFREKRSAPAPGA